MKLKRIFIFLLVIFLKSDFFSAQPGYFSKVYISNQSTQVYDIIETKENTFIIAGEKDNEAFIQKIDSVGQPVWLRKIGNSFNERFTSISKFSDSTFAAAGKFYNNGGTLDILLTKINLSGTILSNKVIDLGFPEEATNIAKTNDGGLVISSLVHNTGGGPYDKIGIVKLDSNLNLIWGKIYSYGTNADLPYFVKPAGDSHLVVCTYSENFPPFDANGALLYLDNSGNIVWSKKYQLGSNWSMFRDFVIDSSGIIGLIETPDPKLSLVKITFSGNVVWAKSFSGVMANNVLNEPYTRLTQCKDKGFLICGKQNLIRTDSAGNLLWNRSPFLYNSKTIECKNGDLIISGNGPMIGVTQPSTLNPHIGIIRSDSLGNGAPCIQNFGPLIVTNDTISPSPITFNVTGAGTITSIAITPDTTSLVHNNGCVDFFGGIENKTFTTTITSFPNPAIDVVRFSISNTELLESSEMFIYDFSGRQIEQLSISKDQLVKGVHIGHLADGFYSIKLYFSGVALSTQLIICR